MSNKPIRVRFAPSPTGPLHIGGVRTALYNYLFAKKNNGSFILRIEDTDQTRFVEGAEEYIIESLKWCGITPNEGQGIGGDYGPYKQSERKEIYKSYAQKLVDTGQAYYAFDTSEDLSKMRNNPETPNWQYDATTRMSMQNSLSLSKEEVDRRLQNGDSYVLRFKMPQNEIVKFTDIIRGEVEVHSELLDDKVLYKSDGLPTYHMANIIDDHLMEISHVIRGEEWLPSAPLHILLYKAFGWEAPEYAHCPLLLRPDGNGKLSKRDGDRLGFPVFPTDWYTKEGEKYSGYREQGYLPEAFINMLALLGWNPGTPQEIFSLEEMVEAFTLDRVSKSGAKFDIDKTKWFQQQYLRVKPLDSLATMLREKVGSELDSVDDSYLQQACLLMKERSTFIEDIYHDGQFLFENPTDFDEKFLKKVWKEDTKGLMEGWTDVLTSLSTFEAGIISATFDQYIADKEVGIGKVLAPFRLLITGTNKGPDMFEVAALLGKEETLGRMKTNVEAISKITL